MKIDVKEALENLQKDAYEEVNQAVKELGISEGRRKPCGLFNYRSISVFVKDLGDNILACVPDKEKTPIGIVEGNTLPIKKYSNKGSYIKFVAEVQLQRHMECYIDGIPCKKVPEVVPGNAYLRIMPHHGY